MFIIIILLLLLFIYSVETFVDKNSIITQQCKTHIKSFPTFLKCNYFRDIYNKEDIVNMGINNNVPLLLNTKKKNNPHKLEVNTYKTDTLYKKETSNCKEIINWIMNYCRFKI